MSSERWLSDPARIASIATLAASWEALVRGHGGTFIRGPAFVAARSPHAVFNNALLLGPDARALEAVREFYGGIGDWALWAADDAGDELAEQAGLVRDGGTTDMARALDVLPDGAGDPLASADPTVVAAINGLPPTVLAGVNGFSGLVAGPGGAGLLLFRHADDLHLSFLATRPEHRRTGLATRLVVGALRQARQEGAKTASLQSTPVAVSLYERAGFRTIGRWTEWVPAPTG